MCHGLSSFVFHCVVDKLIVNKQQLLRPLLFNLWDSSEVLVKKLRGLQGKRNDLAHRALVNLYGPGQEGFDFNEQATQLTTLVKELGALLQDILKEHERLLTKIPN